MDFIRSDKNQNKNDDENTAAECDSVRAKNVDDSDECANNNQDNNDDDEVNCDNAVTANLDIHTDDVPDSQNIDQISLDEHETNAKHCTTTNDTTEIDTAHRNDESANSGDGGGHGLKQKQGHRRLHTPVWARCSIKPI